MYAKHSQFDQRAISPIGIEAQGNVLQRGTESREPRAGGNTDRCTGFIGGGIENYFLAQDVVSRTIDILFTKPKEGGGGERDGGGKTSAADSTEFYSHCEDNQGQNL